MPSIKDNLRNWDDSSSWERDGESWSDSWGSTHTMWFGTILPRIAARLPADHLLEIACGRGRITDYLLGKCTRYTGIDLAPSCVAHCRERFADRADAEFHVSDGRSLAAVGDASISFAFSWDSLVHADIEALAGYVSELATKLVPGGAAFLHHSNFAALLDESGSPRCANPHWRDTTTSAAIVRDLCVRHGLQCRSQELVQWGIPEYSDCFSVLLRPRPGQETGETMVREHPDMGAEISHFREIDELYGR